MEPDQEIRVLRLIEYRYESAERMEQDMRNWTNSSSSGWRGMKMSSAHLPPQVVKGLFSATNDPEPPGAEPRPRCPVCGGANVHVEMVEVGDEGGVRQTIPGLLTCLSLDCPVNKP